jgi:hypothetical protein
MRYLGLGPQVIPLTELILYNENKLVCVVYIKLQVKLKLKFSPFNKSYDKRA